MLIYCGETQVTVYWDANMITLRYALHFVFETFIGKCRVNLILANGCVYNIVKSLSLRSKGDAFCRWVIWIKGSSRRLHFLFLYTVLSVLNMNPTRSSSSTCLSLLCDWLTAHFSRRFWWTIFQNTSTNKSCLTGVERMCRKRRKLSGLHLKFQKSIIYFNSRNGIYYLNMVLLPK